MGYKEYKVCDELKKYIKCFWIMEREYSEDYFLGDKEYLWQSGLTEILYIIGPNFKEIETSKEKKLSNEIVIGAYNKRFILQNKGKVKIIGIRSYNHGANTLFNIDLNNIKNQIIDYKLVNINKTILQSNNNEIIIDYLNEYCKTNLKNENFIDILYKLYKEDNSSIEELCEEANLSLRQFERKVKKMTGFTPKELATIIRFDKARKKLLFNTDYFQVMSDLGYYDYSHFSKDFKRYYSVTPKQFVDMYSRF